MQIAKRGLGTDGELERLSHYRAVEGVRRNRRGSGEIAYDGCVRIPCVNVQDISSSHPVAAEPAV